jgi:DNA-binding response OmpR family regulator
MNENTGTGKIHIIIADDEPFFCDTIAQFLRDAGYMVTIVHDGTGVLPVIQREKVDLVLLDLVMPGMSGLETLELIKKQSPPPRVIVLSGYGESENVEQAKQRGSDGFVTKPFGLETLMRHIRTVLSDASRSSFHEPPIER